MESATYVIPAHIEISSPSPATPAANSVHPNVPATFPIEIGSRREGGCRCRRLSRKGQVVSSEIVRVSVIEPQPTIAGTIRVLDQYIVI